MPLGSVNPVLVVMPVLFSFCSLTECYLNLFDQWSSAGLHLAVHAADLLPLHSLELFADIDYKIIRKVKVLEDRWVLAIRE